MKIVLWRSNGLKTNVWAGKAFILFQRSKIPNVQVSLQISDFQDFTYTKNKSLKKVAQKFGYVVLVVVYLTCRYKGIEVLIER